ncbi:MAG: response regulator [Desulfocapsa sp.]|nr:response regulator [Desulfocapsa sp.]
MTLSWLPVIWVDVLGATAVLMLAGLSVFHSQNLLKKKFDQHFHHYLFLLSLAFVIFAASRSFGHIVKQALLFVNQQHTWQLIAPFSGAINTASFIIVFALGLYFERSRKIYKELEQHKNHLASLVVERTQELTNTNRQLNQEISDRVQTEKKLEKTIAELSAVMDAIDYGILFMDDQLQTRLVNRAFCEIWGMPDDFIAKNPTLRELIAFNRYTNIYDVEDDEFEDYMDHHEAKVRQGTIAPTELKRYDDTILQYQCIVLPNGWRMLTYFDITELKKTQERLVQSQKMEAIGMMAGGVAHDLNNILTGIVTYPDLLLLRLADDSTLRKPLEIIKQSGQRAAQVVADLLTVARGAATNLEVHSLNTLLIDYLKSPEGLKLLSRHENVRIKTNLAADLLNIACSPIHIKKCLMNLIMNGAEAIDGKGTLSIETRNQHVQESIPENSAIQPGEYVVFSITDSGKGIGEQDIKHIFEPFYTNKVMGQSGTGLGLTVVWNTVQEHGGGVTVKSDKQGTCFELYFPVTRQKLTATAGGVNFGRLQGHGQRILVVDDEKQQRDVAAQILSTLGYRVETAASGEEAVAFVKRKEVELVILDMIMDPGINGRQTYEQMSKIRPMQRALIASGFSENNEVKGAQRLGAGSYIRKPYTIEQLGLAVQKILKDPSPTAP